MIESVQVRLEIIKTLLTQAPFLQSAPAGASITEVAEPLVDWILVGSPVDADRVNPIGSATSQVAVTLAEIRRQALQAAEALRDTDWGAAFAELAPSPAQHEQASPEENLEESDICEKPSDPEPS